MSRSTIARQLEQSLARAERLRQHAERQGLASAPALAEAMEELGHTLEELSVTLEELAATNEELSHAQRDAHESARRYFELFHGAPDPYVVTDVDGVIRETNWAFEEKLARRSSYLLGKPLVVLVAEADRPAFSGKLALLSQGEGRLSDWSVRFGDARHGFVASATAVCQKRAGMVEICWLLRDMTERLRVEEVLRATQAQLRAATAAASLAEEHERRRLAQDLHDDVSQLLTLAGMKLGMLRSSGSPEGLQARAREIEQLVLLSHQRVDSLTFQLSPPILHDVGLEPALEWLAEDMERTYGLRVQVNGDGATEIRDETARVTMFRGARELLINVAKHARTDCAGVRLESADRTVRIVVEDRGAGFDPREEKARFGLFNIRERLSHLGGTMEIDSVPGSGTRVTLAMPLREEKGA